MTVQLYLKARESSCGNEAADVGVLLCLPIEKQGQSKVEGKKRHSYHQPWPPFSTRTPTYRYDSNWIFVVEGMTLVVFVELRPCAAAETGYKVDD